jgi:hypothetical protein
MYTSRYYNTKPLITGEAYDTLYGLTEALAAETGILRSLMIDLECEYAGLSQDIDLCDWELHLAESVELETKIIPAQLRVVRELLINVNEAFVQLQEECECDSLHKIYSGSEVWFRL